MACGTHGRKDSCRLLVVKCEANRWLEKLRRRWNDSIKMDLRNRMGGGRKLNLFLDRGNWHAFVSMVTKVWFLKKFILFYH